MPTCPECHIAYADGVSVCERDGRELVDDALFAAADHELASGEVVGEYRIESKLGEGGFGTVYRAVHPVIGKQAAVKVLSRRFSSDPEMVSRFIAEARAANRIQNKNIIDIFAFGALPDGRQYYVMELLEGVTLDQHLADHGSLTPEEAVPILAGIARALDAAHAAGVAHRDLKPENVFLASDEERGFNPKLLDFGIAKLFGDAPREHRTRTGVPMGTPYYMSPEQCRGQQVDARTDIYSFGVLTFQLLTGTLPFTGDSFMDVMMKHITQELPPMSARSPSVRAELDAPIGHMMQKDPAARPATAMAALDELCQAARAAGYAVELGAKGAITGGGRSAPLPRVRTPAQVAALGSADTLAQATTASTGDAPAHSAPGKRARTWLIAVVVAAAAVVATLVAVPALHGRNAPTADDSASPSATAPVAAAASASGSAPSPASAPVVSPAAPPPEIALRIESVPKGVSVYEGDRLLGSAPGPLHLKRQTQKIELVLKSDGYLPRKVQFTPSEDGLISATLQKEPRVTRQAVHAKKPKTPADLEF
jgi:eukaryotic-like serine/threonine-protein kinase